MKNLLFFLIALVSFACSKDDVGPDYASDFDGIYVYQDNDDGVFYTTEWMLNKKENNKLNVVFKNITHFNDNSEPDRLLVVNVGIVTINSKREIEFDNDVTSDGDKYKIEGIANLVRERLELDLTVTDAKGGKSKLDYSLWRK